MVDINDNEFSLLKMLLSKICGIDIPPEKRYLFETRLGSFLQQQGFLSFSQLYSSLLTDEDRLLQREFVQAMTTHESSFFRDSHPFDWFQQKLLPQLAARRLEEAKYLPPRIRMLSAGCSAGQEAYSLAMCILEWLSTQDRYRINDISIVGADVSRRVLEKASQGVYGDNDLGTTIPHRFRSKYLVRQDRQWKVAEDVCAMVSFAEINLAQPFSFFGKFDVILCRNVIIYFSVTLKQRILRQFCQMLNPGGVLLLGASESIYPPSGDFTAVHDGPTTYYVPAQDQECTRSTAGRSPTGRG